MNKLVKIILPISLIASVIHANDFDKDFNHEFDKMQSFFNTMINSDLKKKYFDNTYPKMDMVETPSSYTISFNLAGMRKKDIQLTLNNNNILKVEGQKTREVLEQSDLSIKKEIFFGKFEREVRLPQNINPSTLKTKYIDGILSVTINKNMVTNTTSKVIPIN